MIYHRRKGWEISENDTTPQEVFFSRRDFIGGGLALAGAASGLGFSSHASAADIGNSIAADLYPVKRNRRYKAVRPLTPESITSVYNNFYEFGSHKRIAKAAQALPLDPWTITIDGEVEKPIKISIEDLMRTMRLEERIYRHRCVEAWSMVVPWTGFAVSQLIKFAKPKFIGALSCHGDFSE